MLSEQVQVARLPPAGSVLPNGYPCVLSGWGLLTSASREREGAQGRADTEGRGAGWRHEGIYGEVDGKMERGIGDGEMGDGWGGGGMGVEMVWEVSVGMDGGMVKGQSDMWGNGWEDGGRDGGWRNGDMDGGWLETWREGMRDG